jgi:DNA-binding NarL/FixJ family response regulator
MIRVLIVEDNAQYRESLKATLNACSPELVIVEAESADEALRVIGLFRPQVAFIDINLPGTLNGLQLIERVRASGSRARIAVITNHDLPEYHDASARLGANYFFPKASTTRDDIQAMMRSIPTR